MITIFLGLWQKSSFYNSYLKKKINFVYLNTFFIYDFLQLYYLNIYYKYLNKIVFNKLLNKNCYFDNKIMIFLNI